ADDVALLILLHAIVAVTATDVVPYGETSWYLL
ncbi:hypothetical protein A2U01_0086336, partial [Trifolium medium]|nr:hypothetical protein [Trifolium medium]